MKNNDLEKIHSKIFEYNDQRVMFDYDLAELYGVTTKALNQAVKRNIDRFPIDFMFVINRLSTENILRSQFVTAKLQNKNAKRRTNSFVFTEQGIAMLSSVLSSKRAVQVNIQIMRAFVLMRKMSLNYSDLNQKIRDLEQKYDSQFKDVFEAIHILISETSIQ